MVSRLAQTGDDIGVLLRAALKGWQTGLWTALPGIIQSFNPQAMTCTVQPSIQGQITDALDNSVWKNLPLLVDCPVVFPSAGGFTLTFPVVDGDECLVIFASRCIDSWWQSGGVQVQAELRMHDLSDGFVILGPRSQPRVIDVSTNAVQLRSDNGLAVISIDNARNILVSTDQAVHVQANAGAQVQAPNINLVGAVLVEGTLEVTGDANFEAGVTMIDASIGPVTSFLEHQHFADGGGGPNRSGFPLAD